MKFLSHYSSSKGNLYEVVAENGARLLIEAGVPWAKLQEALKYNLKGIEGCLISHEHKDHCKAFKKVMQHGIRVYSALSTWEALSGYEGEYKHWRKATVVQDYEDGPKGLWFLESFDLLCFSVQHDVPNLGYVIRERATDEYLLFVTDFFALEQKFPYPFSIVALSCSYEKEILQRLVDDKAIDEGLAKRLLFSHPSKEWLIGYLRDHVNLSKCRGIYLLHASASNLDAEAARREIEEEFMIETFV